MNANNIGLIHDATELRKLIAENPDLPIVVLAGDDANPSCEYAWMYCASVTCNIDYILDVRTPYDRDTVFTDKGDFEDEVSNQLWNNETMKLSDSEYEAMVQAEVAKYETHWRKVIAVYANN